MDREWRLARAPHYSPAGSPSGAARGTDARVIESTAIMIETIGRTQREPTG
jgi:hypothetical protein